ncbi:DUF2127 domain-containing protein [Nocardia camponoti]|uniref:DUF2127 domain-containing protein n=1 Tax=Nocardia camponoti TaxID=1616106 RepID=A0A917VBS6_9NOCA|nr:DUF2127 domain-containing protein [Nocardia camponoti]GGK58785.1 hypothetical protein GCM10011591_33750 [Nocardia camponoti]
MDWALRTCAIHGHYTYAPTEPELRARLEVSTVAGTAWRCLRCGTFVPGKPVGTGPADEAPFVPRGRLLRDRWILKLLAVDRAFHGVLMLIAAMLAQRFRSHKGRYANSFDTDLPLLQPFANQIGWNVDHSHVVRWADDLFKLSNTSLLWIAVFLYAYAALHFIEAIGLWLAKRWGEYLSVIATSVFLPLEIYELIERVTVFKVVALVVNLLAVWWLVWRKRLFGANGGWAAYQAEHSQASLLSVERAAVEDDQPKRAR